MSCSAYPPQKCKHSFREVQAEIGARLSAPSLLFVPRKLLQRSPAMHVQHTPLSLHQVCADQLRKCSHGQAAHHSSHALCRFCGFATYSNTLDEIASSVILAQWGLTDYESDCSLQQRLDNFNDCPTRVQVMSHPLAARACFSDRVVDNCSQEKHDFAQARLATQTCTRACTFGLSCRPKNGTTPAGCNCNSGPSGRNLMQPGA